MTKRKRADSLKNSAIVQKEILTNPLQSQREIAKKTGISKGTVYNKLNELGHSTDERLLAIADKDFEILQLTQKIILEKLKDKEIVKNMKPSELAQVGRESFARCAIINLRNKREESGVPVVFSWLE